MAHRHVGQIVCEPVSHDDPLRYQILPIGGYPIGGHLPAAVAQSVREIVQGPVPREYRAPSPFPCNSLFPSDPG